MCIRDSCEEAANHGTRIQFIMEGKADLRLLRAQLSRLDCIQHQQIDHAPQAGRELAMARSLEREALAAVAKMCIRDRLDTFNPECSSTSSLICG